MSLQSFLQHFPCGIVHWSSTTRAKVFFWLPFACAIARFARLLICLLSSVPTICAAFSIIISAVCARLPRRTVKDGRFVGVGKPRFAVIFQQIPLYGNSLQNKVFSPVPMAQSPLTSIRVFDILHPHRFSVHPPQFFQRQRLSFTHGRPPLQARLRRLHGSGIRFSLYPPAKIPSRTRFRHSLSVQRFPNRCTKCT